MNNDLEQNQKKPTFEEWLSTRTDTIESDCGCVSTETFYHWLKVAYEAAQAVPDGWNLAPDEATLAMITLLGMTGSFESMQHKYKNMLAAAHKPESE